MVNETERRDLYDALAESIGPEPAATMMELLPGAGWSDLARQADITTLRAEMVRLESKMDAQLPKLVAANIASMIGVAGLVLAAAKLA